MEQIVTPLTGVVVALMGIVGVVVGAWWEGSKAEQREERSREFQRRQTVEQWERDDVRAVIERIRNARLRRVRRTRDFYLDGLEAALSSAGYRGRRPAEAFRDVDEEILGDPGLIAAMHAWSTGKTKDSAAVVELMRWVVRAARLAEERILLDESIGAAARPEPNPPEGGPTSPA